MACPLCQKRPSKRACPAVRQDICPVCCATKRLVEIQCPEDCRYLDAAQKHPAAVVRRQIDRDLAVLMTTVGRLSEQQLQLLFLLESVVLSFKPDGFVRLTDVDIATAASALAVTLDASDKGLIIDEAASSPSAEELRRALKTVVDEVLKASGSRAAREVAVVLRAIERGARHEGGHRGARHEGGHVPDGDTAYLELVGRVFQQRPQTPRPADKPLIVMP